MLCVSCLQDEIEWENPPAVGIKNSINFFIMGMYNFAIVDLLFILIRVRAILDISSETATSTCLYDPS